MQMKDSRGLNIMAKSVKLIVHPSEAFNAYRILNATLQSGKSTDTSATNNPNAMREMGWAPQVVVDPYLDDADQWFVTTDVGNGLLHFARKKLRFAEDGDFDTGNLKHKAQDRYAVGWADWRGI